MASDVLLLLAICIRLKMKAQPCRAWLPSILNPPEADDACEDEVQTPEGDRCMERGRWAMAHRKPAPKDSGSTGRINPGFPSLKELEEELGGPDGCFLREKRFS